MDLVTVYEAAKRLGISEGAVRQRIHRGTLDSDKDKDGRVYVYLPEDYTVNTASIQDENNLLDELRDRIRFLEEELKSWKEQAERKDEEARRKDTLLAQMNQTLAQLASRIPEIEPAPEQRESSVTASEDEAKGQDPPASEKVESRPWWQKLFGT